MAAGAAMAPRDRDVSFDNAFGGNLFAGAARGALMCGAEGFPLFGERLKGVKFGHA